jgi:ribonuclease G
VEETGSRDEIEERALPFRVGEEVLVTIEEPHMFNDDDAVARVDSYIVSVTGGGDHIGERKMVRIETVQRSSAVASLLESAGDDGAKVESKASKSRGRRGSRGGRRRSRAGTGSKSS